MTGRLTMLPCRGCLGPLDRKAQAGLCGRCWSGLVPLAEARCPRCALAHGACTGPGAWRFGDAFWQYRAGRPPLGALLVPAIKRGEGAWLGALLDRARRAPLPAFAAGADLVCAAPTSWPRRWLRGADLAEAAGALVAARVGRPFRPLLRKTWFTRPQAGLPESRRRQLPASAVSVRGGRCLDGAAVLVVDDVWTTGTTLLRCAQALGRAGAGEVAVLALFRAVPEG